MRERSTDDLGQELMGAPNIDAYIHNNEAFFSEQASRNLWRSCMSGRLFPRPPWPGNPA